MSAFEYSKESFATIAFRTLFLQVYAFKGGLTNFHVLYKIRRYVDSEIVKLEHSYFDEIAKDIMQVKNVEDPFATEIVYSWMSLWLDSCIVDVVSQRNEFYFVARTFVTAGEDIGFTSLLIGNAVIGPVTLMRHSKNPNCKMIIEGNRIYFEAIEPISPGDYVTVEQNAIVKKELVLSEMEQYGKCKSCEDNKSQLVSEFLPMLTPVERTRIMKDNTISDMEKKVFEEVFHAYQKMPYCYRCLVHRCTYFQKWPKRTRLTLSNEIPFQTWTFSRFLTVENPLLLKYCATDDPAHGYITEDEYDLYKINRNEDTSDLSDEEEQIPKTELSKKRAKKLKGKQKKTKKQADVDTDADLLTDHQETERNNIVHDNDEKFEKIRTPVNKDMLNQIFESSDCEGNYDVPVEDMLHTCVDKMDMLEVDGLNGFVDENLQDLKIKRNMDKEETSMVVNDPPIDIEN